MSYVVGLTGGIGSGKTVVSDHFETLGVPIIDTDIIAREIVEPGQITLVRLSDTFGKEILTKSGKLDRSALRDIAFSTPNNKQLLDSITHPAIRTETLNQLKEVTYPYCIVVVPLLTEDSPFIELMNKIIVVIADRDTKVERVMQRSNLTKEETIRIMESQISDQERTKFANNIIENNGTISQVQQVVEQLHRQYLQLSNTFL